jgi:hypothetical protein
MAINYGTPVGLVRLNITDTTEPYLLTDDQLTGLLFASGENVNRATARALRIIATSEVLVSKVIRTQDLSTDGAKVADALMRQAAAYEARADAEEPTASDESFVGYISPVPPASYEAEEWRYPQW